MEGLPGFGTSNQSQLQLVKNKSPKASKFHIVNRYGSLPD